MSELKQKIQALTVGVTQSLLALSLLPLILLQISCGGKYVINTFPAGAKVYLKDIQTQDRKLIGLSPVQINEESRLGNVFFIEFEKENYLPKEVMVKINEGESLTVSSRLDPINQAAADANKVAKNDKPEEEKPKGGEPKKDDGKKKDLEKEIDDLKLRVALLENTAMIHKDAIFSARFRGGPAGYERDEKDRLAGIMFDSQQAILKGQYDQASTMLDKAIQLDEYYSQAWLLKGSVSYLKKDLEGARRAWERTLKIDPYNKAAYTYLAEVYKRLGVPELPAKGTDIRLPASQVDVMKRQNDPRAPR